MTDVSGSGEPESPQYHITIIGFDLQAIETAKFAASDGFNVTLFRPLFPEEGKHIFPLAHKTCIEKDLESLAPLSGIEIIEAPSISSVEKEAGHYTLTFTKDGVEQKIETHAIITEPLTGEVPLSFFPEIACRGSNKVITTHPENIEDETCESILYVTEGGSSKALSGCNCHDMLSHPHFAEEIVSFARENKDIKITVLYHSGFDTSALKRTELISEERFSLIEGTLAKIVPRKNGFLALSFDKATSRPLHLEANLIVLNMVKGPVIPNNLISDTVDFEKLANHNSNEPTGIFSLDPYKTNTQNSLKKVNEFLMRKQQ